MVLIVFNLNSGWKEKNNWHITTVFLQYEISCSVLRPQNFLQMPHLSNVRIYYCRISVLLYPEATVSCSSNFLASYEWHFDVCAFLILKKSLHICKACYISSHGVKTAKLMFICSVRILMELHLINSKSGTPEVLLHQTGAKKTKRSTVFAVGNLWL